MAKWTVDMITGAKAGLKDLLKKEVVTKAEVKVLLEWVDEMEEFGLKQHINF